MMMITNQKKKSDAPRAIGAIAAALALAAVLFGASPAQAQGKGSIEFGLGLHYNWPVQDLALLEPGFDPTVVSLLFHYWLNSTTSVMAGLSGPAFTVPFELKGQSEDYDWRLYILYVGLRYRPPLDLLLKPYLEAGLGYDWWRIENQPSIIDSRDGGTIIYFLGAGLEYDLLHKMTAGLNLRYFYAPMAEDLKTKAWIDQYDHWQVEKSSVDQAGYLTFGIEFTYRIK